MVLRVPVLCMQQPLLCFSVFPVDLQNVFIYLDCVVVIGLLSCGPTLPEQRFDIAVVDLQGLLARVYALLVFIPFERDQGQVGEVLHLQLGEGVQTISVGGELLVFFGEILSCLLRFEELLQAIEDFTGFVVFFDRKELGADLLQESQPLNFLSDWQLENGFFLLPVEQTRRDRDTMEISRQVVFKYFVRVCEVVQ